MTRPLRIPCAVAVLLVLAFAGCSAEDPSPAQPAPAPSAAPPTPAKSRVKITSAVPGAPRLADGGAPTTLFTMGNYIQELQVRDGVLYFIGGSDIYHPGVFSCPLAGCGGSPTLLVAGIPGSDTLPAQHVTHTDVYWGYQSKSGSSLMVTSRDGGATTTIASKQPIVPNLLLGDSKYIYSAKGGGGHGTIERCAIADACGTSKLLAGAQDELAGLAIDATNVYWTAFEGGTVVQVPITGGTPTTLVSGDPGGPQAIAVDATSVYFTDFIYGNVKKCAIVGCGNAPTLLASGLVNPLAIAVDKKDVYFITGGGGSGGLGTLVRLPVGGGAMTTLATFGSNTDNSGDLLLTDDQIVWVSVASILTLPK